MRCTQWAITEKYGVPAKVADWPCNRQRSRDMQYSVLPTLADHYHLVWNVHQASSQHRAQGAGGGGEEEEKGMQHPKCLLLYAMQAAINMYTKVLVHTAMC